MERIADSDERFKIIFWFAETDDTELVKRVKDKRRCILVSSYQYTKGSTSLGDLVQSAFKSRSNLIVESVSNGRASLPKARILDPLLNVFMDYDQSLSKIGGILRKRTTELLEYNKMPAERTGQRLEAPDEKRFFTLLREYGGRFYDATYSFPEAPYRFLGNASFRTDGKDNERYIYFSQRNIDKRTINQDGFVAVEKEFPVRFHGKNKPSVDTPIQLLLYQHYPVVRYMLHQHVYVKDAKYTERIIPCAALEEAEEVIRLFPERENVNFAVNLKGHGSLLLVDHPDKIREFSYVVRNIPEVHKRW